jgi:hypothetical protein
MHVPVGRSRRVRFAVARYARHVSTSRKEPKALTKAQFGGLLAVLAVCAALALLTMAGVAGKHGECPTDPNSSRAASPTCWATYNHLDETGVVGIPAKPAS